MNDCIAVSHQNMNDCIVVNHKKTRIIVLLEVVRTGTSELL
jgi:hypothetical protein